LCQCCSNHFVRWLVGLPSVGCFLSELFCPSGFVLADPWCPGGCWNCCNK
jgi:hypothetical protein